MNTVLVFGIGFVLGIWFAVTVSVLLYWRDVRRYR